ncbi:MAG: 50S ribosomal protein L30 [Methanobacteriota archaeon]|nr:MAG: 50S ribosomal protein L30 [Euryarchaeota archaeon]
MTWAIVRIRGKVRRSAHVTDTLRMLRLTRQNHCVIVPETPAYRGMVKKVKDFITWGEVTPEVVAKLLLKRGGLTDAAVKENSRFKSVWDFSQALAKGEATVADVKGLRPVLRLHPPRGGFIAIKRPFRDRGDLGYRGAEINELLERMIFEEAA